jgi:hypothetical protein
MNPTVAVLLLILFVTVVGASVWFLMPEQTDPDVEDFDRLLRDLESNETDDLTDAEWNELFDLR